MMTARLRGLLLAAMFGAGVPAVLTPAVAADKEDTPKEQALKLNELDTPDQMQEKLTELLKNKAAAKKLVKAAAEVQKGAGEKEKPFNFNAALVLAKLAHNVKEYDAAERFYDVAIAAASAGRKPDGMKVVQAYEGLLDLYFDRKNWQSAADAAQKFIDLRGGEDVEQAKAFMLEKFVQAKAKLGDIDEALKMAEGLAQLDKGGWYFLQLKGWVQREAGKLDDAIATYKEVLDRIKASQKLEDETKTRLSKNVRYLMTGLYVDNDQLDKAADILKKLIEEDPDNPTYYNDLGFIWADHDKNLDESEKLIKKALELDTKQREKLLAEKKIDEEAAKKENAAYLDSLGWVYFKKKEYAEAEKYLRKAAEDDDEGKHIEIWDHLADTLVAEGKKKEAVEVWQKALRFEDISPRDAERRKKVTQKLNKLRAELTKAGQETKEDKK